MRRVLALALAPAVIALVAGCGGGSSLTSAPAGTGSATFTASVHVGAHTTTRAAGPPITLMLQTSSPQPSATAPWPIVVSATPKVNGIVSYAFLFNGSVVSRQPGGRMRDGVYDDKLLFPPRAEGVPLTLEVLLHADDGRTADVQRAVTTTK